MSMVGKSLAHYSITAEIGKGGMGVVYQAKDQKLGRDVAIKVLPEEFAQDIARASRFQREAKLLASLNHPNIAAIHGLEEADDTHFLVMELIEGDTLADRIKSGPIPAEEALKLALQIAEALEAAHEKGVIHRDLKPANIKVTPDGKVKVLDFGLAKAFAGEEANLNLSNSPTLSAAATQQGTILGTAAYMSPEQARGKAVDRRADIWAFGCVLFEMLAGRPAFGGQDVSDILAAVIRTEPEWSNLPGKLHWRLREVLERCLKKELKGRYHDISDVQADILWILRNSSSNLVLKEAVNAPQKRWRKALLWIAATALPAVIVGSIIWNFRTSSRSEPLPITRFSYELPSDLTGFAASPNGRQFVYTTSRGLYLQSFDEIDPKLIPGTEERARRPFFSPDGKWIGYFGTDSKLKKINISGGAPIDLCAVSIPTGALWNQDDKILFGDGASGIHRISANGGTPELLVKGVRHSYPQLLPDGKSVLFTDFSKQPVTIQVQSIQSGEKKNLFEGIGAHYLPTGHIVYALGDGPYNIFAVPFNLERLEATGGPVPIVNRIDGFSISNSGTLLYLPGTADSFSTTQHVAVWVDQKGKEEPIPDSPNNLAQSFALSPDGTRVALVASTGGNSQIWIWGLKHKTMTQLTFDESGNMFPLWTRDGRQILYETNLSDGQYEINMKAADGTGIKQKIGAFPFIPIPYSWSGDGKSLVMLEGDFNPPRGDIAMLRIEGDQSRKPLLAEKYVETQPSISRDGRWIAYVSREAGGKAEVYVRPFPDVEKGKWRISDTGGLAPLWSKDSKKLFYRSGDAVMAVEVETDPAFKNGKPEVLFRGNYYYWALGEMVEAMWAIGPDDRFMMVKEVKPDAKAPAAETPTKINIVLNWFEELKQRVPIK
jgi:serine/threonine protein kinase